MHKSPSQGFLKNGRWVTQADPYTASRPLQKRTLFPATTKWNGDDRTFPMYETAVTSWLLMSYMGYLVEPAFLEAYDKGQWDGAKSFAPQVTPEQFRYDNQCVYGALLASAQQRGAR